VRKAAREATASDHRSIIRLRLGSLTLVARFYWRFWWAGAESNCRHELPTRKFSVLLIVFSPHLTRIRKIHFAHCHKGFIVSGCLTRRLGLVVNWSSAPQKACRKSDSGRQLVVRKSPRRVPNSDRRMPLALFNKTQRGEGL
jgi:hypothetical protein